MQYFTLLVLVIQFSNIITTAVVIRYVPCYLDQFYVPVEKTEESFSQRKERRNK